jgi:hypothetical protein
MIRLGAEKTWVAVTATGLSLLQLTVTFVTFAEIVPEPFVTVQVLFAGDVATVTE